MRQDSDGEEQRSSASHTPDWGRLVKRIQENDSGAMEELYRVFGRGIRFYLWRQLGPQELDDRVHDTFLIVVQAIRRGDLREPERLMGFVRTVVRRQVAASIEQAVQSRRDLQCLEEGVAVSDKSQTPEENLIRRQRAEIMAAVLRGISPRDREILTRFYLLEQPQEQICLEMNLTDTQFRLLKSRAKARFGELGRRKLARRPLAGLVQRKAAGSVH
ncbi:MAG: sigma-70 family RNA polymerase sigma factor [Bryobacterales bacterium]|jgi:RNA polymerase sigma factor (sigma-70 family)|nr:sigma-70 family RNA polymerase sigma factor [Bryobacterales bacterium]